MTLRAAHLQAERARGHGLWRRAACSCSSPSAVCRRHGVAKASTKRGAKAQVRSATRARAPHANAESANRLRPRARPCRAQIALKLRRRPRLTQHSVVHALNRRQAQRWSVQGGRKKFYGAITSLCTALLCHVKGPTAFSARQTLRRRHRSGVHALTRVSAQCRQRYVAPTRQSPNPVRPGSAAGHLL